MQTAEALAIRQSGASKKAKIRLASKNYLNTNGIGSKPSPFGSENQNQSIELRKKIRFYWQKIIVSPLFLIVSMILFLLLPDKVIKERLSVVFRYSIGVFLKRSLDILLALIGIVLFSPFLILIPILIKLDSRGTILYRQLRVGQNRRRGDDWGSQLIFQTKSRNFDRRSIDLHGEPFYLYKFRTMKQNAELMTGPVWASQNDTRVTRVGRILRATHLDELPQFINVLRGDMSIVGPRPERPCFVAEFAAMMDDYTDRFQIKPGITGSAQIYNGYDVDLEGVKNKLKFEIEYINNRSLYLDIKLIFLTVRNMILRKGGSSVKKSDTD
ncbi:sugar transferase [candidate division KSB1 bacterium]|nr:sugar transferase [candidate division KSB1 bacterium]